MIVAVLPLMHHLISFFSFLRSKASICANSQSSKPQDGNHQDFGLFLHLQLPHNKEWQQSKRPIRNRIQHRNNICENHDDIGADAFAMVVRIQIPPEGDRSALEGDKKTIRNGEEDVENHHPAYDPDLYAVDGDAEEKETDANLESCSGEGVEDFAEEPVLFARDGQYCPLIDVQRQRLTIKPICAVSSSRSSLFLPFP